MATINMHLTDERSTTWTDQLRLLHQVYQAVLKEIRLAREFTNHGDEAAAIKSVLRSQRLILEIVAGLNPSYGDIPDQVSQLCMFCLQCLDSRTNEDLLAAEHVLTILAEGFAEIEDEICSLEAAGQLPTRQADRSVVDHVV